MHTVPVPEPEASGAGCKECLEIEHTWVHLRKCLECGHVGCCDFSIGKHATAHARGTRHHVIRSIEPGENWRYCYADEAFAE
jgi:CPA1 family monovalent cation:H+ antiporter